MKTFNDAFKTLFKKVTGLNIIDLDKLVAASSNEADAKQKISWLVKKGVISNDTQVAALLNKIDSILDGDPSTVDSWEEETTSNSGLTI